MKKAKDIIKEVEKALNIRLELVKNSASMEDKAYIDGRIQALLWVQGKR